MAALAVRAIQVTAETRMKRTVRMKNREFDSIPLLSAIMHYRLRRNVKLKGGYSRLKYHAPRQKLTGCKSVCVHCLRAVRPPAIAKAVRAMSTCEMKKL